MRMFWAFVVVLALAAGGLLLLRHHGADIPAVPTSLAAPAAAQAATDLVEPTPAPGRPDAPGVEPAEPVEVPIARAEGPVSAEDPAPRVADVAPTPGPAAGGIVPPALLLNDRYKVTGSGTAEDPYTIDFDMLVALERDYQPKAEGKTQVPDWIKPLDDKFVVVTGFIGFPFLAPTADECMVMLNQWDGCCIGVPPTPYDAVEVKLAEPVDLAAGVPNYGTLTGRFRTDPYLVNGWLIGLYVMDEARLTTAGGRNQAGY